MNSPPAAEPAASVLERIHRNGPIRFGAYVDLALYDPNGFFTAGGGAGRAGRDFVTSPEVGSLFGVCVARAIDREWERLGRPDPFVVIEGGAGNGRLAREVLRTAPNCSAALRYVLVERSERLRAEQATRLQFEPTADLFGPAVRDADRDEVIGVAGLGPVLGSVSDVPGVHVDGVVLANELLDNLAFEVVVRTAHGWDEVRVGELDGHFVEVRVPAAPDLIGWVGRADVPVGTRLPVATGAMEWLARSAATLRHGSIVLIDYCANWETFTTRAGGWLRTYADHRRAGDPLSAPGSRTSRSTSLPRWSGPPPLATH